MKFIYIVLVNALILVSSGVNAQSEHGTVSGVVSSGNAPLSGVTVSVTAEGVSTKTCLLYTSPSPRD